MNTVSKAMALTGEPSQVARRGSFGRVVNGVRGIGIGGGIALTAVGLVLFIALLGPLLTSIDPNAVSLGEAFRAPTAAHPLGLDSQGRDLFGRLLYGARTSVVGPLLVVCVSTVLGTSLALAASWWGGWFDAFLSRVIDAMFAFPGLLLAILATALFGTGLVAAGIALSISYIPYLARIVRSAAIRERSLPYVSALTVQGLRGSTICFFHILPNLGTLIMANAALLFGYALIDLASLSFIGLGVQPPTADWGVMVAGGVTGVLQGFPQESLYAGGLIVVAVAATNFLGDRLTAKFEARG
jgi:peptide/nickel transport system permease protein